MGNFSRDPDERLQDSIKKHYVGVRLQQGVPLLDADWNEMEGLNRYQLEEVGTWIIGNGVPANNDGFRIVPLINGGINSIILTSKTLMNGTSSLEVVLSESTAAEELGFNENNYIIVRPGSSPAKLTSNKVQPFILTAESKLVVKVDDTNKEIITFKTSDFVNISTATADEIVKVINAATSSISASVSKGNDFIIKGGEGTKLNAGRIIVDGQMIYNELDIKYTEQPLYENVQLGNIWEVDPIKMLIEPGAVKSFIVYLDVWNREVDCKEDEILVDERIGIETAIRMKREWAVRVASVPEDLSKLDNPPDGHLYYKLANLNRIANEPSINGNIIEDLRDTQLSILRKIEARNSSGVVVVDTQRFLRSLENTRDNIFAFVKFITTQFNPIDTTMTAAEILGLQALEHIATTSEIGIGLISSDSLANRGALKYLLQLYHSENNFMTVWRDIVLQLGTTPKKYATFTNFINRLDTRLNQETVGNLTGLLPALQAGDLEKATTMQEEIHRLIGSASANIPEGNITVFLAKSPLGNLTIRPNPYRFEFRVRSFTTMTGTYTVNILPAAGWPRMIVDSSGNPLAGNRIQIGASGSETTFYVDVTVQVGSCGLQLRVTSDANPVELNQLSGLYTLDEGAPAPQGEDEVQFHIARVNNGTLDLQTGILNIVRTIMGTIEIRVFNYTGQQATFNLTITKENSVGNWIAEFSGGSTLTINNESSLPKTIKITPTDDADSMNLKILATTTIGSSTSTGQLTIPCVAI